jgi:hypothetical protein
MNKTNFNLSIDRSMFRKRFAEALFASAQKKMPMIMFYDRSDGSFDFANTFCVGPELLPIIEVDANKIDHALPLDDPKAIEIMLARNEEKIFERLLPELIERLMPNSVSFGIV